MAVIKEAIKVESKSGKSNRADSPLKRFIKDNWLLIAAIIYVISPFDFIPDFLPIAGYGDDIGVLAITLIQRYITYKKTQS